MGERARPARHSASYDSWPSRALKSVSVPEMARRRSAEACDDSGSIEEAAASSVTARSCEPAL